MPVALRGARVAVSVRAVVAFVVVLVVAVVFFAVRVARAQQAAAPQLVPAGEGLVGRTSVPSAFTSAGERCWDGGVRRGGAGRVADLGRVGSRLARAGSSSSTSSGRWSTRASSPCRTVPGSSTS